MVGESKPLRKDSNDNRCSSAGDIYRTGMIDINQFYIKKKVNSNTMFKV